MLLLFSLALLAANVLTPIVLVQLLHREQVVLVVDQEGNVIVGPGVDFAKATRLHSQQAMLAASALLNRNPTGFQHPEQVEGLFVDEAGQTCKAELEAALPDLKSKDIRQVCEVGQIDVKSIHESARQQFYYIEVRGEIVQNGLVASEAFRAVRPFTILFKFLRNPRLTQNGKFPLVCVNYSYKS